MQRLKYEKYLVKNYVKILKKRLNKFKLSNLKQYAGKPLMSAEDGNEFVGKALEKGEPFCAVRFGSSELATTVDCIAMDLKIKRSIRDKCMISLCRNAGFFPNDKNLAYKYGKTQSELLKYADVIGIWGMRMEDYIIDEYSKKDSMIFNPRAFEPYYFKHPWSKALEGKKVLVIHPFAESIQKQYEKRELLFENKDILPKFELHTLKAVQSAAFNDVEFSDWFEALQYMFDEAMKIDFDVAIVGCGAYGLPLCLKLKKSGKSAIHMAGSTQILFGIKGARWDNHPVISKLYNEYWIRPSEAETPKKAKAVENACYW